jgi:hypothetical protein
MMVPGSPSAIDTSVPMSRTFRRVNSSGVRSLGSATTPFTDDSIMPTVGLVAMRSS